MITRLERDDDHLRIESRRPFGRARLAASLVGVVVSVALLVGMGAVLAWLTDRAGSSAGASFLSFIIAVGAIMGLLSVAVVVWLNAPARERLLTRGTAVRYECYVGPFRTARERFDLLSMQGLRRWPEYDPARYAAGGAPQQSDDWKYADFCFAVWYNDEPFVFGQTVGLSEHVRFTDELLAYHDSVRQALGLDIAEGMRDRSVWTPERMFTLDPSRGDPDGHGGRHGYRPH